LSALPESLGRSTVLARVDLTHNQLQELGESLRNLSSGESPAKVTLLAWIEGTRTTVTDPADLDAILDRLPPSGLTLAAREDGPCLFVALHRDQSALIWEGDDDILLGWGPAPADALPGPWFLKIYEDTEPLDITEEHARRACHELLRTGRRPTNVRWVQKP
jgi:hypothetical protein